jgi:molybdopterin-guanine dinucleotide biosynthesis protein A
MASAAILAGGRATRFGGRDKSALVVDGRSILERQLDELARLTDDVMIVGASNGPAKPCSSAAKVRQVADRVPGRGPLGGLDAALASARDDALVVVACDMPFVTADLLAHLLSYAPEADAVVPCTERGYHPLCAVYTRRCQEAIRRRLAAGQLQVRGLFEDVRISVVTVRALEVFGDPRRLLANVNTREEHEALQARPCHEV